MTLFGIDPLAAETTTDEWYTPPWVFKAADLTFDLDVCAPIDPLCRTVPASRYYTVADDGLSQPWHGIIWCNPPYRRAAPWVDRWAAHPEGLLLVRPVPEVHWVGTLMCAADAITFISLEFVRPDGRLARLQWPTVLAARGARAVTALRRVAQADEYAAGGHLAAPSEVESGGSDVG